MGLSLMLIVCKQRGSFSKVGMTCLLLVSLCLSATVSAKENDGLTVRDPHFGKVLFYFYQQDYFSALTNLVTGSFATCVLINCAPTKNDNDKPEKTI